MDVTNADVTIYPGLRALAKGVRRSGIALTGAFLCLVVFATPAWAHGAGGSDASDFRSTVTGIVAIDSEGRPAASYPLPGVTWRVLANDALLQVENRTPHELTVKGYGGEPYLRIGPQGVWENQNSEATYLNADRFGGEIPEGISNEDPPNWRRLGDEPVHAWHDHRIHWMSRTVPPAVAASTDEVVEVFDWFVPFSIGGRDLMVAGDLSWIRPDPAWPWLLGAAALLTLPLVAAFARPAGERRNVLLRTAAVVLGAVILVDAVHSVDDVLAVPATFAENLLASAQSALFLAIGAVGAVWAWRAGSTAWIGLLIGAAGIAVGIGVSHVPLLASSQIATTLPEAFSRAAVAASLTILVPAGIAAWLTREPIAAFSANQTAGK